MAFTDSIKWNGKSIRDFFLEITNVSGRGKPAVEVKSVSVPGRHGQIAFKQTYKPRIIEIEGTIEGVSHATLMSNIDNLKSLFAMEDELLSPGEESITDSFKYGKLEFGDESDRHYNAVFDSVFEVPDISHQWMRNEMKLFRARFRCDEPFAISNSITEATMAGSVDEFKVFSTGNVQSKPIIELSGAVTNPMLIEGDKVGVAHFDYNDNLSDVTLATVSGNFSNKFGYR
ncbi:MAG: phage tail family protein, partial [Candidatus Marinimicrobia bacterium]|nr:phage tail family protein [Candidatus Neomarinimicrobiota bacterium]